MNSKFYVAHMYITRILLITCLAYAFLSRGCPTCDSRIEANSPAFFADEYELAQDAISEHEPVMSREIEVESEKEADHA